MPDLKPEKGEGGNQRLSAGKTSDEKSCFSMDAQKDHGSMNNEERKWENSSPSNDYVSFKVDEDEYLKPMSFRLPVQKR